MAFKQHDDQYDNISMISPHSTRSGASDTVSHSPDGITVDRAKVVIDSNPSIHDGKKFLQLFGLWFGKFRALKESPLHTYVRNLVLNKATSIIVRTLDNFKFCISKPESYPRRFVVSPREEKSSSASSVLSDILRENGHISEPDSPVCVTRTGCKDHRYSPKQQMINKL